MVIETLKKIRRKLKWLDPFTYVDLFILDRVKKQNKIVQAVVFLICMLFVSVMFYLFVVRDTTHLLFPLFLFIGFTALIYLFLREEAVDWGIYLASAFFFALVIFSAAGFFLNTDSPMMIVVSGSMEPALHRGDVVILQGASADELRGKEVVLDLPTLRETELVEFAQPVYAMENGIYTTKKIRFFDGQEIEIDKTADTIVYYSQWKNEPIIHRIVAKVKVQDGTYLLTKGDNKEKNTAIDQDCGRIIIGIPQKENCISRYPIKAEDIEGRAIFLIPVVGYAKLLIFDDLPALIFS